MNNSNSTIVEISIPKTITWAEKLSLPLFLKEKLMDYFSKRNQGSYSYDGHADHDRHTDNSND